MAELGATVLGQYVNNRTRVLVVCAAGHEVYALPGSARRGGFCAKCAGNDSAESEGRFLKRLAELGATPLYKIWQGVSHPHDLRCAAGHARSSRPADVMRGDGVCRACAGNCPQAAEAAFRARLGELGATLLEPEWLGSGSPHHVRDAAGHDVFPTPGNVRGGWGICKICAGKSPVVGEADFRARLAEMGCTPLYEEYRGRNQPHHCLCPAGHDCYPRPSGLQRGQGACATCAHRDYTVFYVLEHEADPVVKFGVSGQDGRRRLGIHRLDGFTTIHLLVADLASGVAKDAEDAVRASLALAGESPVRGREYFDVSCLGLILDIATPWLGAAAA
jgi:hypothetical protein